MKKHILLAEDEEATRITFSTILGKAGYDITLAEDGRVALSKMIGLVNGDHPVDLLITDINMDGLNGLQLVDQLQKLKIMTPVLAITGYGDKDLVIELMRRGCQEYIEKPFEALELLERVAKILKKQ